MNQLLKGAKMKLSTRDMILVSLFAALMAVGAFLKLPNPLNPAVPITFQLFFCIYAGILLGSFKGALSQVIYMLIGLSGVPVFTGGGGYQYVVDPKFGFILSFIVCAWLVGAIVERLKSISVIKLFAASLCGLALVYLIGNTFMYMMLKFYSGSDVSIMLVNGWMLPYMIKDGLLMIIVAVTSVRILPAIRKAGY